MIISAADLINTIIQSILLSYVPYYFIGKERKKYCTNFIIISIVLFFVIYIGTRLFGNTTTGSMIIYLMNIIIIGVFYGKKYKNAIIAYNLVYFCIQINSIICGSMYFGHIQKIIPIEYNNITFVIALYCPQLIMQYLIFKNISKFRMIYKDIILKKYSFSTVLIANLSIQYLISYTWIVNSNDNALSKDIIMITAIVFVFVVVTYFADMQKRINEVSNINQVLDLKLDELKKVKHDYGAQISYLYGLHLMGRHERLGELLKDIINGNDSILDAVELSNNSDSVISIIMREAVVKGINVVIDDTANLDDIIMSELELQRVISNIVSNSITAMDGTGLITVKAYKRIDNIVIKIQNNGPKIDDNIIDDIFNLGFSTKNNENNGFGLAIVKEIIEKYEGTIKVKSTDKCTEFKISLPIRIREQRIS